MPFEGLKRWLTALPEGRPSVSAPRVLDDTEVESHHWDLQVDVAVLGFGGAGAAAAIEARDQGANVAVLERFNGGGSTKISGGIVYAGGGTRIQAEAGVSDSPQNMFNYLVQETGDAVEPATLHRFCADSSANLEWLIELGVPFQGSQCPYKTSYPSNDYYFYYSGNESFAPYCDTATPAPRGHRALGKGVSGTALFEPLGRAALQKGVQVLTQQRALGLISSTAGRVIGVQVARMKPGSLAAWVHRRLYDLLIVARYAAMFAPLLTWLLRAALESLERHGSELLTLRATRGVVVSTGGFSQNRGLLARHAPDYLAGNPLGTIGDDGSGIIMAQDMNASAGLMGNVSEWRFINPPQAFVRGILIDSRGRRICNEMLYGAQLAQQIMTRAEGQAWLLIDTTLFRQSLKQIGPSHALWFQSATALLYLFMARKKANNLEQLARKLDIPAAKLRQTVFDYNRMVSSGRGDSMGKTAEFLCTLGQGPWYALDCRIDGKVRNPTLTLGGLRVDEASGAVLAVDGHPIPGLYAAGRSAVGVASHAYVSGLSIADCFFSGRRAGASAAGAAARG